MDKATRKQLESFDPDGGVELEWDSIRASLPFKIQDWELINDFPHDLTAKSLKELGQLHSKYSAYLAFVNEQLASSTFTWKKRKLELSNLRSRKIFTTTAPFKAKVFAKVNCDAVVMDIREVVLQAEAVVSVWRSILWSLKGYMNAIEFEVPRRGFRKDDYGSIQKKTA